MHYLPLIGKDSVTHMHGLAVYVNERLPFAQGLYLENSADSFFFNWDPLHARLKQPLQGMELQEKETQKQGIQEICLERTYS